MANAAVPRPVERALAVLLHEAEGEQPHGEVEAQLQLRHGEGRDREELREVDREIDRRNGANERACALVPRVRSEADHL